MKLAINGLLSLTPDGNPIIGETPEVKGLWSAAAIWIKEAPGIAKTHRRVDDERRARDRPARLGHRPVLRPPQDRAAHRGPDDRGLQQDLRHRPPDGAVGLEPRRPALAVLRAREGARRRVLRGRGLGAAVLVRHERARCSTSTATGSCRARPSGSRAGGRRSSTPSTSRCATGSGWSTCPRSRSSTSPGPGAAAYLERLCVNKVDVPAGQDRLHAAPQRRRRDPRRPHDHAARPRPVPRRDRRRHGHARQEALHRRAAGRRLGAAVRRDELVDDDRAVGAAGARHPGRRRPRTTSPTPASRS